MASRSCAVLWPVVVWGASLPGDVEARFAVRLARGLETPPGLNARTNPCNDGH